jgi:uncharacterized membrane protein (DUF485 family)
VFLISATIFFLAVFFIFVFLAAFTTVLNSKAVGPMTWAYIRPSAVPHDVDTHAHLRGPGKQVG